MAWMLVSNKVIHCTIGNLTLSKMFKYNSFNLILVEKGVWLASSQNEIWRPLKRNFKLLGIFFYPDLDFIQFKDILTTIYLVLCTSKGRKINCKE